MATIERIRQRSGLLIVVVFVALMAFLLGDLFQSGGSRFFGDPNVVGSVNGVELSRMEMSQKIEELRTGNPESYANSTSIQLANFVWNSFMSDAILNEELAASGMSVHEQEIYLDVITNPNIRQSFTGENGKFDPNMFASYLSQVRDNKDVNEESAEMWRQWLSFENAVANQANTFKFNNAIEKALFMPPSLVEAEYSRANAQYPAQYVYVPYIDVNENEIEVSESDAKKYYQENKDNFTQKDGRNIEFINFPLAPSQADRDALQSELALLALEWFSAEDDSVFVNLHSDIRFVPEYFTVDELIGTGLDTLVDGQDVGYQKGPIDFGDAFAVVKLVDKKILADSVQARHILIPFAGATRVDPSITRTPLEAKSIADSLFSYLKENRDEFESVSDAFSSDITAKAKGGDLGYFPRGMMAKPFENFCFYGEEGDFGLVPTQFGFHLIEITNQKGENTAYKIGQVIRKVLPSSAIMTITTLYWPMIAMFTLTAIIGMSMARLRFKAVSSGDLNGRYYRLNRGGETPEYLAKVSNNFDNLMATPILFYIACIAITTSGFADVFNLTIAWLYVASRAIHSWIHTRSNRIMPRMRIFMTSLALLTTLWLSFAVNLFTSTSP